MPPCDATPVSRAVFIQSLLRRKIPNMFDIKDKSSQINNRVVTCMPVKTNRRRQIVAGESRRDVYAGTTPVCHASATYFLHTETFEALASQELLRVTGLSIKT